MTCEAAWHRIEHSGYTADLPLWLDIAQRFGPETVEVGAGCGRVAHFLASRAVPVTAVERDPGLAFALTASTPPGSTVQVQQDDVFACSKQFDNFNGVFMFPLLVAEVIAAEYGRDTALAMLRDLLPSSASAAFCVSGGNGPDGSHAFELQDFHFTPASQVTHLQVSGALTQVLRTRADVDGFTEKTEVLMSLSANQLSSGLGRAVRERHSVPAVEGVVSMQVVVL